MDTATAKLPDRPTDSDRRGPGVLDRVLTSPLLWGGLATIVFYWIVRQLPGFADWGQTLFCGHPLAYATTTLFWVGIASLGIRMLGVPRERRAIDALPQLERGSRGAVAAPRRSRRTARA